MDGIRGEILWALVGFGLLALPVSAQQSTWEKLEASGEAAYKQGRYAALMRSTKRVTEAEELEKRAEAVKAKAH